MISTIHLSQNKADTRPLETWERDLGIPARTLIHHASMGHFPVLVRPPLTILQFALFRTDPTARPPELASPIFLPKSELIGLVPDQAMLIKLIDEGHVTTDGFEQIAFKNLSWDAIRGVVPGIPNQILRISGWKLGSFLIVDEQDAQEPESWPTAHLDGQRAVQKTFLITPDDIVIRDRDIKSFLESMEKQRFISEFFSDDAFLEEFPTYISGKLQELIKAKSAVWRTFNDSDREEIKRKRAETLEFLKHEFRSLCDKKTNPDALIAFAADACDPSLVPQKKRTHKTSSPDLLLLATAAKLFWSPSYIDDRRPETHPPRESVTSFLQRYGMTTTNAASYGTTLIRPETASAGKKEPPSPFFKPKFTRSDLLNQLKQQGS